MDYRDLRAAVVEAGRDLADLTPGRSGNCSARDGEAVAVTPSGIPYGDLTPADVPVLARDGETLAGDRAPSSETPLHLAVYDALDAGAVVHAHSPWATTLAALREPVPAVHYGVARAGGRVPVAEYATYGTDALADSAVDAMRDAGTTACLLANHGLVAAGEDPAAALETARSVEFTARVACQARAVGDPAELPAAELARVAGKFAGYGQR